MTPGFFVYFDHSQSKNEDSVTIGGYTPIETVYNYEPVPKDLPADKSKFVLGAQANLWTEYIGNVRKAEYMIFPRMSALSEVLWTPKDKRNWKDFEKRMPAQFKRYDLWNANYSRAYLDILSSIAPSAKGDGLIWTLRAKTGSRIKVSRQNKSKTFIPVSENSYIRNSKDARLKDIEASAADTDFAQKTIVFIPFNQSDQVYLASNGSSTLRQQFNINKSTGKMIRLSKEPVAGYLGNGGAFGLVNGVMADPNKPTMSVEWMGWRGDDLEAVIDLGKNSSVSKVSVHANSSGGSRVYPPTEVQAYGSTDGSAFNLLGSNAQFTPDQNSSFGYLTADFKPTTARYIKVIAKNYTKIPQGMRGEGDPALILIDEIVVQ